MVYFSIPKKIRDWLDELAEACADSRSEIVRIMVNAFYDDDELKAQYFPEVESEEDEEEGEEGDEEEEEEED